MAERSTIGNKLKLVVAYKDANNKDKNSTLTFSKLKNGVEPATLLTVAQSLAGLQQHMLAKVEETSQNEIMA